MRVARLSSLAAALLLAGVLPAATAAPVTEQPPERLTLSEVLAAARASAPALLAARSREAAATAAAAVAGRWTNPEIEIRSENWGAQDHELPLDSFATVRQALELGGKRGARRHAAETAAVTAGVGTLGALREIEGQVAGRFLDAVRQRDRAALRREQIESLDELLRILDRRVEEGVAPEADRARLRVERAAVGVVLVRAEAKAERAFLELAALADLPDGLTMAALESPGEIPLPEGDAEALIAEAADARPDTRQAAVRVESAEAALALERAARIPDLAVDAGLKRTLERNTGVLGASLTLPVFDRRQVGMAHARGELRAAELEREGLLRLARADAAAALGTARRLSAAAARVETSLVEPATLARAATRSAFDLGAADLLRLVDAERTFAEARLLAGELRIEAATAAIQARLALGEGPLP